MPEKPRIVLGLMGFGPEGSPGARISSLDDFKAALDMFQQRGYSDVDTARLYIGGRQEGFTRETGWKDRGLAIATKVWPIPAGSHSPKKLMETFETSLRELGTDSVDILYLHAPDRSVPFADTLEAVDKLHQEGKFQRLGLSNYASFEVAEIVLACQHNGWVRPTVYQALYNCVQRSIEDELIPTCRRYGISVDVYSPTGGGFLAGKIKSKDDDPQEGRYAPSSLSGWLRSRYFKDGIIAGTQMIREAAEKHDLEPLEVAIRWLVHHSKLKVLDGGNDGVIIAGSTLKQIKENMDWLEKGPLSEDLVEVLERAWKSAKADADTYWQMPMKYGYDTLEVLFGPGSK